MTTNWADSFFELPTPENPDALGLPPLPLDTCSSGLPPLPLDTSSSGLPPLPLDTSSFDLPPLPPDFELPFVPPSLASTPLLTPPVFSPPASGFSASSPHAFAVPADLPKKRQRVQAESTESLLKPINPHCLGSAREEDKLPATWTPLRAVCEQEVKEKPSIYEISFRVEPDGKLQPNLDYFKYNVPLNGRISVAPRDMTADHFRCFLAKYETNTRSHVIPPQVVHIVYAHVLTVLVKYRPGLAELTKRIPRPGTKAIAIGVALTLSCWFRQRYRVEPLPLENEFLAGVALFHKCLQSILDQYGS